MIRRTTTLKNLSRRARAAGSECRSYSDYCMQYNKRTACLDVPAENRLCAAQPDTLHRGSDAAGTV